MSEFNRSTKMKKPVIGLVVAIALLVGVICFTPIGESVFGLGFFVVESGRYLKKERALTEEIRGWPASKFEDLAVTCAQLAGARPAQERGARSFEEMQDGVPIPSELLHLKPQRVWIDSDSVTIELMHMMDSDVTLTAGDSPKGSGHVVCRSLIQKYRRGGKVSPAIHWSFSTFADYMP